MKFQKISLLVMVGSVLAGCTPAKERSSTDSFKISAGTIADSKLAPAEKSEELAKAAEQLMTAQGFEEAQDVNALALKTDPTNLRALFIQALMNPIVAQKGILARIRPLMEKHPLHQKSYENDLAKFKLETKESSFKRFLLEGPADITTEKDLQKFADELIEKFEQLRLFAKDNKDRELTVRATAAMVPDLIQRYARACEIITTAKLEYELKCPDRATRTQVVLNRADFEYLQSAAAVMVGNLAFQNSYDLTGMLEVSKANLGEKKMTQQQFLDELLRDPNFGRLRDERHLKQLKGLSLDLIAGLRLAASNQPALCPLGKQHPRNRVGKWINTGICVNAILNPYITLLDLGARGAVDSTTYLREQKTMVTKVDHLALFNNPVADLRSLGLKVNHCRSVIGTTDPTFGGTFPKGDAQVILPLAATSDCPQ